jgi:AraC family transcriptional regulator
VVERNQPQSEPYAKAIANVLAYELSCGDKYVLQASAAKRGGLTGWQMRAVTAHIEENLDKQFSLAALADLVRLSQYHFCRAFKQSFGTPPHHYHLQRRIERAKILLSERSTSITEIGLILGYSHTSSFALAFRKITGQTPSDFRRNFALAGTDVGA